MAYFHSQGSQQQCVQAYASINRSKDSTQSQSDYMAKMTVKQLLITRNSRLQGCYIFKAFFLIIDCFHEIASISSAFSTHFATSYIQQTWTTTTFMCICSIPRVLEDNIYIGGCQYNQVRLFLTNSTQFIRELRLDYEANEIETAINRVKSL